MTGSDSEPIQPRRASSRSSVSANGKRNRTAAFASAIARVADARDSTGIMPPEVAWPPRIQRARQPETLTSAVEALVRVPATYCVEIAPGEDHALVLAIAVCVDALSHRGN
jgi:hypothetical protein